MGRRRMGLLDGLMVAWTAVWVILGLAVASEVRGLRELSGTLREVGGAVEQSGRSLESLGGVPFVGERLTEPTQDIVRAGRSIRQSGASSRESIQDLSLLLGLSVGLIPAIPVLGFYVPWRVAQHRERRALAAAAARWGDDPAFERYLAFRAAHRRPLWQLEPRSPRPWQDLTERDYRPLAEVELAHAGVRGIASNRRARRERDRPDDTA